MTDIETGEITGTADRDYNLIWFTQVCLRNALRLETYIADAERADDGELADFFRRAQHESRKGADAAKAMLLDRIGHDSGSASNGSMPQQDDDESGE